MRSGARPVLTILHRWVGLVLAGFLVVTGLTGSLLAWFEELEAALSPSLMQVQAPQPGVATLDPLALRERVVSSHAGIDVRYVPLTVAPGRSAWFFIEPVPDPLTGQLPEIGDEQVFVDPYTGAALGTRQPGDLSQGLKNLMTFVYRLHYSLALGSIGVLVLGVVSLLWMLDCLVGAWLTLPAHRKPGQWWLGRWSTAWRMRWTSGAYRFGFDLHRAGGLWTWAMLFVLAWSSVAFNLPEVYGPAMRAFFTHQPDESGLPKLATPRQHPRIGWHEARDVGRRIMAAEGERRGFTVQGETAIAYDPARGSYKYVVRSSLDLAERRGETRAVFDGDSGALLLLWLPTGAAAGDTLQTWISGLHTSAMWGVPMQVFVCIMGVVVVALSVTGWIIWARKRWARAFARARRRDAVGIGPRAGSA
jgi:uncharacterized iron-regulated membrane protein